MNKQTFLELMKAPEKISEADFVELETLVKANPYFQNGHCILAHASRGLKKPSSSKKMSTAAIYSTNRNIFKQYILGQVKFTKTQSVSATKEVVPKTVEKPKTTPSPVSAPRKAPSHNTDEEQSALVKEIYENLEKWKASREHYLDYDKKHPEEIVIEDPHASKEVPTTTEEAPKISSEKPPEANVVSDPEVSEETKVKEAESSDEQSEIDEVQKLKNQVAEEIEAEEKTISKALSEIAEKKTEEKPKIEENKEEDLKVKPKSDTSGISSDELTAIVDAESSMEDDESTSDDNSAVEDIEESITTETSTTESAIVSKDEIQEVADEAEEIVQEPEAVETNSEQEEKSKEAEVSEKSADKETQEVDIDLAISIDTSSDKSTEETEQELDQIGKEIQELKLTPGSSATGKKFRLGVLKRGTKFTKEKVKKSTKGLSTKKIAAKKKEEPTAESTEKTATKKSVKKETPTKTEAKKETTSKKTSTKETKVTTTKKETPAKKSTAAKKATPSKTTDSEKKTTAKSATSKTTKKATGTKADPKAKKESTKKEPAKKASPKFRMSATLGAKTKKKTKDLDAPEKSASESKSKSSQSKIIDTFLKENPTINVNKKNTDPETDLSSESDTFPGNTATENLTHILEKQGKFDLAISVYDKLILKHPEKEKEFQKEIDRIKSQKSNEKQEDNDKQNALLSDFIEENPTILVSNWKELVEVVEEFSKDVSTMADELITESMANIHLYLSNNEKAISILERLILIVPAKKADYTAQIKKITKK
ncbi:hypothetical protein SAMN04488029_3927 [Reichenbachiella faecimaris]|uniref:Tetratricopeptide repeat-containing protein n=1 Tax=Reichenbachiella faecimaris TaxID=692418 RepID=A0A1W2GQP5_REIFA|nr:hypothetical protein [Reichenbachiella faecimaris]SMD38884.1 hypothetical protein SAMN04488029_3927 [Reichenbachiella faecimaris]